MRPGLRALLEPASHHPGGGQRRGAAWRPGAACCAALCAACHALCCTMEIRLRILHTPSHATCTLPSPPKQAHILIFLIAAVQICYCCISMLLCLWKVRPCVAKQPACWQAASSMQRAEPTDAQAMQCLSQTRSFSSCVQLRRWKRYEEQAVERELRPMRSRCCFCA